MEERDEMCKRKYERDNRICCNIVGKQEWKIRARACVCDSRKRCNLLCHEKSARMCRAKIWNNMSARIYLECRVASLVSLSVRLCMEKRMWRNWEKEWKNEWRSRGRSESERIAWKDRQDSDTNYKKRKRKDKDLSRRAGNARQQMTTGRGDIWRMRRDKKGEERETAMRKKNLIPYIIITASAECFT